MASMSTGQTSGYHLIYLGSDRSKLEAKYPTALNRRRTTVGSSQLFHSVLPDSLSLLHMFLHMTFLHLDSRIFSVGVGGVLFSSIKKLIGSNTMSILTSFVYEPNLGGGGADSQLLVCVFQFPQTGYMRIHLALLEMGNAKQSVLARHNKHL
uniref:Uncharacterized protein n=1 Tax=Sphaerodactylus townsendi TaxID=933632 RepID=A0ACB8G5A5_9SAUR